VARAAAAVFALAALAAAGVAEWPALTASFGVLAHLHWIWIPVVIVLEAASMAAFAIMLRRLLAAGGTSVGVRSMLATTYAANALSVSVPLAGPELGTAFTFRRFTRQGADAPLAGWSLLAGGVASSAAAALLLVGGALSSGNVAATAAAVPSGVLAVAALVLVGAASRRPRLRGALEGPAAWTLRHGARLFRRPADDPRQTIRIWAERLGSLRVPASGWITVTGLALANWLADAGVLAVSIHAAGAAVPWHLLLLIYGSGVAAQSLNIVPGGLGITEGTLGLTLIASGLRASQALAAVLLYRLASFWLVAFAGWLVFLWLRRRRRARRDTVHEQDHVVSADAAMTPYLPGTLRSHELVLLHGQPGTSADWQQLAERLPARLHAIAADRPGYGSSPLPPAGFAAGARTVLDELDSRGIQRAVLVGHSYGGGVALSVASLAPHRVEAVVLLASVGPGCVNGWDRLLAAPGVGPLCALIAWRLTPWIARYRLARITRRRGSPLGPDEHVNWQVWGHVSREHGPLWRSFLAEQRALLRELDELVSTISSVQAPVLLLADPEDALVPVDTARRLAQALPHARLQLVGGAGHHLPRRAADVVANAIVAFMAAVEPAGSPG
jgi:pimeloyl-ACP methyl ester carboxylesterase